MTPTQTKYKHIHFKFIEWSESWLCHNNKSLAVLAELSWYTPWWRWIVVQFSGEAEFDAKFDASCLRDIADFLDQLNKKGD